MAFVSRNAFTGKQLLKVPYYSQARTSEMIERLHTEHLKLKEGGAEPRIKQLKAIAEVISAKRNEITEAISEESGKVRWLANGELDLCLRNINWFCENLHEIVKPQIQPKSALTAPNVKQQGIFQKPLGVIYQVSPFNFPFWISHNNQTKNIAMGNTVLSRPDKGSIQALTNYENEFKQNGVTAVEFTYSDEKDLEFIMSNPKVNGVTFTGSCGVGKHISEIASRYMKKSLTELGGSDPFIVMEDADMDLAVEKAVFWRTFHAGQVCVSPKRMIVHESVVDEFTNKVLQSVKQVKVGEDPKQQTEPGIGFSPMSREDLRDKVHDQVQRATQYGDKLIYGGNKVGATFYEPTVMRVSNRDSPLMREEVFGPVFAIASFKTEKEALDMANDTEFGLSGSVYSKNEENAIRFANQCDSGMVHINDTVPSDDPCLQFGGNKSSGIGRNNFKYFTNEQSFLVHDQITNK